MCDIYAQSWWTAGPDQAIWGTPEDIYVKLKEGYDAAGIPIKGWEPDNNFVVDYKPIKNWIGVDWNKFDEQYYPSGGEAWVAKMVRKRVFLRHLHIKMRHSTKTGSGQT
jgi:hypothetical protein